MLYCGSMQLKQNKLNYNMKREIKFKGVRIDNGEWVEGLPHFNAAESTFQITKFIQVYPCLSDPCGDQFNEFHNIKYATVSQFTGKKDVNGIDVFEGDYDNDGNCVVWCDNCSGWEFAALDVPTNDICIPCHRCDGNFFFEDHINEFKIIGNINDQNL